MTATVSATWHNSGCISVCPASFIPFSVIVSDPHSTKVGLLSYISPWHLTVSECLSWTAVMTVSLALWVLEVSFLVPETNLKSRKNEVTSFCCKAFSLRHWNYVKVFCCHLAAIRTGCFSSFDRLFLSQQWWVLDIEENSPIIGYAIFGIHSQLQTEQLFASFFCITSQTVHSLYL